MMAVLRNLLIKFGSCDIMNMVENLPPKKQQRKGQAMNRKMLALRMLLSAMLVLALLSGAALAETKM